MTMPTEREVVAKIESLRGSKVDPTGVMAITMLRFLKYRWAKPWLQATVTKDEWDERRLPLRRPDIENQIRLLYPAAWRVANERERNKIALSMFSFEALLWLLGGEDRLFGMRLRQGFEFFSKPQLVLLDERLTLGGWEQYDDGEWVLEGEGDTPDVIKLKPTEGMARWRLRNVPG